MADNWNKLLRYILETIIIPQSHKEAQLDATAVQDVRREAQAISEQTSETAQRLERAFSRAMDMAWHSGGGIELDDTRAEESDMASAMAQYLVTTNLATSSSTSLDSGHFRYRFDVNWPAIERLANQAGIALPGVRGSTRRK